MLVKFTGRGGYQCERDFAKDLLVVGNCYKVVKVEVSGWNTDIYLEDIYKPYSETVLYGFNSALFEDSEDIDKIIAKGMGTYYV